METSASRGLPRAIVDDVFLAPVYINAGGTVYTTTLTTLTKYPESKLAKLFNGTLAISIDPLSRHYFLDVSGSVFGHVLDFLRYGELLLPDDFTQLPLLTKLADYLGIEDMIQVLMNIESEESSESKEEGNINVRNKKKFGNRKHLRPCLESQENENNSIGPEITDKIASETNKVIIGTCELGIMKLGMLEGGKVNFGTIESASIKNKKLESEMFMAIGTQTEKLSASNIESEVLEAKSSKVDMLKAEQFKSDVLEVDKVSTGNTEIGNFNTGLIKTEILETTSSKSETVDMGSVNANTVKVKSLESETLKLKTIEVEMFPENVCSLLNKPPVSVNLGPVSVNSEIALVHVGGKYITLCTTASNVEDFGTGLTRAPYHIDPSFRCDYSYAFYNSTTLYLRHTNSSSQGSVGVTLHNLLKLFKNLTKNGYKLFNMTGFNSNYPEKCEYVFFK